jgi:hypothetical protein
MVNPLRKITAEEFARRLREASEQKDKRYAFFLGAGCSVSSGIPASSKLVREVWLPRLRDLRAPDFEDSDEWAARAFAGYDRKNPAALYGPVIEELFLQPEERQREMEILCDGHFPGFGYATLAGLMTRGDGGHFNIVLTTNFDDLVPDALYLFTQARPLVIHHESLATFIRPTRTRPLVVKLHGDNRLSPQNTARETERLKDEIQTQIRTVLYDRGLIFIGYGGNDRSIKAMLEALPPEALPLGVYWVSDGEPRGEVRPWLEARKAIWVGMGDFDQLMFLIKNEFDLPNPDGKRFQSVFENYVETYQRLSSKIAQLPDSSPDTLALKEAVERYEGEYEKMLEKLSWWFDAR